MIPACLKFQGFWGEAKAIFHFNMIASTAQGLQNPRCKLKTSLHPFQRCFSKKCFILTLGCVKMMGWPKYLAANCLAPVVFRATRSRLTLLGDCLWKKVIYWAVKRKLCEAQDETCVERGLRRRRHAVSKLRSLALLQWLLTLAVPSMWPSMSRASTGEMGERKF